MSVTGLSHVVTHLLAKSSRCQSHLSLGHRYRWISSNSCLLRTTNPFLLWWIVSPRWRSSSLQRPPSRQKNSLNYMPPPYLRNMASQTTSYLTGQSSPRHSGKSFTKLLDIESHFNTAFHPETDCQTKGVNQVLEQHLITHTDYQQSNWCTLLPFAEFAYNSAPHPSTTVSPFFANKGFDPPSHFTPKTIPDSEPTSRKGRVQGPSGDR